MVSSSAKTVEEYLKSLPEDRKKAVSTVRELILKHLPNGYEECMLYGMIAYVIPKEVFPNTYNDQPLRIAGLASQKNYMSLYLMSVYGNKKIEKWFNGEWKKTGKKLDMGKSCVRFKKLDDLPLELIGKVIEKTSVKDYIEIYKKSRHFKD